LLFNERYDKENCMKYQLLIALLGLSLVTAGAWGFVTDISGTWAFTIERATGPVHDETFVFKQASEKLTGTYSGMWFREQNVIGSVKGDQVVFSWDITTDGGGKRPPTVTFVGKLESPSKMTGTVEVPYCVEGQNCKWTATKKK